MSLQGYVFGKGKKKRDRSVRAGSDMHCLRVMNDCKFSGLLEIT